MGVVSCGGVCVGEVSAGFSDSCAINVRVKQRLQKKINAFFIHAP